MSKLSRRRFLAGAAGCTVALPLLESVEFSGAAKANDDSPVYTAFFKQGNGVQQSLGDEPERFWPSATGALTRDILSGRDSGRAVSELADFADQLLIVSGLNQDYQGRGCGHAAGLACLLTAHELVEGGPDTRANGESVDWFIGTRCNPDGVEPLNLVSGRASGNYVTGNASYSGPRQVRPQRNNPIALYRDLFGDGEEEFNSLTAERQQSVNDLVRAELTDLMGSAALSSADRVRLDQHFSFIRDLEVRMACGFDDVSYLEAVRDQAEANDNREDVMRMLMDITALSFACDLNRVAVLQMGSGNDGTRYFVNGSYQNRFHRISHRVDSDGSDGPAIPNADLLHHEIDRLHARIFRHFLERLSLYSGPSGGSLLNDCMACWTNDLSNGPPHGRNNMPFVIAGSGGGFLRQGQYLDMGGQTHNKLWNTFISAHGIREGGDYYGSFGKAGLDGGILNALIA
ncbi:MAG: DUF1552 domain-containing protein [Myxococcota bacterium]